MKLKQAIRQFDLLSYIQRFDPEELNNGEWVLRCPICGRDKKLAVNVDKRKWKCWICVEYTTAPNGKRIPAKGAGGVLALIQVLDQCTKAQAIEMVLSGFRYQYLNVDLELIDEDLDLYFLDQAVKPTTQISFPEGCGPVPGDLPFLLERGITMDDVQRYGLFFGYSGRYRNRLIFPVWEQGLLVYFQARATWKDPGNGRYLKMLNPENAPGRAGKSDVVMNLDVARHYSRVALVEGPIDCVHAGPSSVCTFGKEISIVQMLKLHRAGVKAVDLMWDGPSENEPYGAWSDMIRVAPRLSALFDTRLVFIPWGDPGMYPTLDCDVMRRQRSVAASNVSQISML
jgi:hypothetical protein